jgi:actin-related protein 5
MEIKQEPEEYDDRVLILKEPKTIPDIVHEYTPKEQKQTLIFDNGSSTARVGFSNKKTPQLIFKNLVAKPRKDRNKKEAKEELQNIQPVTQIGNDILNIEAMRFQLRTQFDRNIVTHFYLQVSCYSSSNLCSLLKSVTF